MNSHRRPLLSSACRRQLGALIGGEGLEREENRVAWGLLRVRVCECRCGGGQPETIWDSWVLLW